MDPLSLKIIVSADSSAKNVLKSAKHVGKQLFHTIMDVRNDILPSDIIKTVAKWREADKNLTDKAVVKVKSMIDWGKRIKSEKHP